MIADMSFAEVRLLTDVVARLERLDGDTNARAEVLGDIANLLRAQHSCSYVWNNQSKKFDSAHTINLSDQCNSRYQSYYQHHDPMTFRMREAKCAIVSEVMDYKTELYNTEYYQMVMKDEGMMFGINMYMFDGDRDIGDLRIWRDKSSQDFQQRDKDILLIIEPYLKRSILRLERGKVCHAMLTNREHDVAQLVCKGLTDKEISIYLNIGFSTVRTHLNKSMSKLGCSNRAELAASLSRGTLQ
ncbi:helix-turn-helix transcriptional regulator [Pseudomonas syringae]|uniref:helix-turn-helix domain-containing protein n=1 Tax=Pseudomonas syringae TaxID=317 RepID=UPI00215A7B76|nr:helix-turn-helix transcriptional regulator [Pseudomonas syringae]MCR8718352.1 helix-turn-helix transcriptional regulator [Pseudomonas syringae]